MKGSVRRASAGLAIVAVALWAAPALASSSSVTIEWSRTTPLSGTVGNDGWLEVDSTTGGTFPLAAIDGPVVSTDGFAIVGEVSFRGLEGSGYLEMWSVFPDGTRYFSRTLAPAGRLAALSGGSGVRTFALPFDPMGVTPSRLEVNLVLPGAGRVRIGPLRLSSSSTRSENLVSSASIKRSERLRSSASETPSGSISTHASGGRA